MISNLISYIDLTPKRVKTEELNIKDKIIKSLNIIRISHRGRAINLKLNNPRKESNQYSINPKIQKKREKIADLSGNQATLARIKVNNTSTTLYHLKNLRKEKRYTTANNSNKTKMKSKTKKQILLTRFFENISRKVILISIFNRINLFR